MASFHRQFRIWKISKLKIGIVNLLKVLKGPS